MSPSRPSSAWAGACTAIVLLLLAGCASRPDVVVNDEAVAEARKLVADEHFGQRFLATLHEQRQTMVSRIAANSGQPLATVETVFDKVVLPALSAHIDEFSQQIAYDYAMDFTADELRQLDAFTNSPGIQKVLETSVDLTMTPEQINQMVMRAIGNLDPVEWHEYYRFSQTPIARKLAQTLPVLQQQMKTASTAWVERVIGDAVRSARPMPTTAV